MTEQNEAEETRSAGEGSETETAASADLPVVAIVGRPNAGKSTFFNRIVGQPKAIVNDQPGVTRDRNVARAEWDGRSFLLVDTGGFEDEDTSSIAVSVRLQSALAAEEADVVIVLLDGREGLNPADRDFAERLRRLDKPVFFAANKLDTGRLVDRTADFFALGLGEILPVSAEHGLGIDDLMDRVVAALPPPPPVAEEIPGEVPPVRLAIVGRPNVGKSSLLNRLVGYERSIVSPVPGTTRDAIDTPCVLGGHPCLLIDTAGIRRRPKVVEHIERSSAVRALKALERAELGLLVLDATEGMTDQDARIAGYGWERGRAMMLVFNKWDAVPTERRDAKAFLERVHYAYPTLSGLPVVFLSAHTGAGVKKLWPAVTGLVEAHRHRARTAELNAAIASAVEAQAAPAVRGRPVKFLYATQTGSAPPTVTIFTNYPDDVPASYQRYLANELRRRFGWYGTPLRIWLRPRRAEPRDKAPARPRPRKPSGGKKAAGKEKRPRRPR